MVNFVYKSHHPMLTVWVLTWLRLTLWAVPIMSHISFISDNLLALWVVLALEWQSVDTIHDQSVNFSVVSSSASFRTDHFHGGEAMFAIETGALLALDWINYNSSAHYANEFSLKFSTLDLSCEEVRV